MKKINRFFLLTCIGLRALTASGQSANSVLDMDGGLMPPSPNAQMSESIGNIPVSLYEGIPTINFPVYNVKCGSLSLPISLSYYYNGLRPQQDAGWVGLGWSLNAGGVITRYLQGAPDGSEPAGYNYGEYDLYGKLFSGPNNTFLQNSYCTYNNNTNPGATMYDLAPDLYQANFNGNSAKFYWFSNKAYMLPYIKGMLINWPSPTSNITITTPDGVIYTFGAKENTTGHYYIGGAGDPMPPFASAWYLTSIISPDKKDTISLSYGTANWTQYPTPYDYEWVQTTASNQTQTYASNNYSGHITVASQILQSITCRNTKVNFILDAAGRSDISGSYPSLHEIDVIDMTTGNTIKKQVFNYEYFNQGANSNTVGYNRLKLKQYKIFDSQLVSDSQTYKFSYINEYGTNWPIKSTLGIDFWGYYNGADNNPTLISNAPGMTNSANRNPSYSHPFYGTIDTIVYPMGGYATFQYSNNDYGGTPGPGIRVNTIQTFLPGSSTPATKTVYAYSGGDLSNAPSFSGPTFSAGSNSYVTFNANDWSSGRTTMNSTFNYSWVSEQKTSGTEIHRSDYSFLNYSSTFNDVELTHQIDYLYNTASGTFTPISDIRNNFTVTNDTSFYVASAYLQLSTTDPISGLVTNTYGFNYANPGNYWKYRTGQTLTQYDQMGNSIASTTNFNFNTARNLVSTTQSLPDGRVLTQKFKHPEDYTTNLTGSMITANVLSPVLEKQEWIQYGSSSPGLIAGQIITFDQTVFKPNGTYAIETTAPISTLNNETMSGNQYSSLLSDSRYSLREQLYYDGNANRNQYNKASDISTSYIWDYSHSLPIAEARNAQASQIAYTSFEADGAGNWAIPSSSRDNTAAITGNQSYNLTNGSISLSGLNSTNSYIISYWSKTGSSYTVSGSVAIKQGKTIGAWTYFEHTVTGITSVSVSGAGNIDELRFYPTAAQMSTLTYSPLIGVTSQCDVDNRVTYYTYDGLGRLRYLKDQDGNIIKTIEYHLQGQ